jgi:hypothetical protein
MQSNKHSHQFKLAVYLLILVLSLSTAVSGQNSQLSVTAVTKPQVTALAYQFVPGRSLIYQFDYLNNSASDMSELLKEPSAAMKEAKSATSKPRTFNIAARGKLVMLVLANNGNDVQLTCYFRQPEVRLMVDGRSVTRPAEIMAAELSREIWVTMNMQGRVLSVGFDPAVRAASRNLARAILAQTQFVVPNNSAAGFQTWEAEEDDPNGQYIAQYQFVATTSQFPIAQGLITNTFRKTKVRYLQAQPQVVSGKPEIQKTIIPSGETIAQFDFSQGRLISLEEKETQIIAQVRW